MILEMIEAAHQAPSGGNNQPWRYFYAIHGTAGFDVLLDCLDEGNQRYANKAGALIISAAQMRYVYKDREYQNAHAWHDTGMANALLMIQGISLGLKSHPMGGFDPEKARKAAGLGPDYQPVVMIAVGYQGSEASLPPDLQRKQASPRNRKPLQEVVKQL